MSPAVSGVTGFEMLIGSAPEVGDENAVVRERRSQEDTMLRFHERCDVINRRAERRDR